MDQYNFSSMWKAYSSTGNETLGIGIYNATGSLALFAKSGGKGPIARLNLDSVAIVAIERIFADLRKAEPGTRIPIVKMAYNSDTRQYSPDTTFVFFKNEKHCYGIEVTGKTIDAPIRVALRSSNAIVVNGENNSEETLSEMGVTKFLESINDLRTALLLSRLNWTPPQRSGGNNSGGGNNNYRNNNNSYGGNSSKDPFNGGSQGAEQTF